MIKRLRKLVPAAVLALTPVLTFLAPGIANAATITWTGGGTDGNWSTTANWSGGVIPASGDTVVIDNAATFTNGSDDDIANLNLAGLTFINDASGGTLNVTMSQPLTISGPITQDSTVTTTTDSIGTSGGGGTLTLGSNVTVTSSGGGLTLGADGDTLDLGSNTLTFTDDGTHGSIVAVDANITGSGSVVFNGPVTDYQLWGTNTYSGTTHVIATDLPVDNANNTNAFGTSAITIENGGSVSFTYAADTTISNPITVTGTASGSPVTSLNFGSTVAGVTLTVPNVTLNGSTRFANDNAAGTTLTVNLAGIQANGHCVEYLGYGNDATNGPANGFTNGPTGCILQAPVGNTQANTPKTPDTGFALAAAHPVETLALTVLGAAIIGGAAYKLRATSRR